MNCEFSCAPAWWYSLREATNVFDHDSALDLLLVDVVDGVVGDGEHALLRPLKLIDLFNHCRVHKRV